MNKRYLLIAGDTYYPSSGTRDWIGFFDTYEEAESQLTYSVGKYSDNYIDKNGNTYDWYHVIDLWKWTK